VFTTDLEGTSQFVLQKRWYKYYCITHILNIMTGTSSVLHLFKTNLPVFLVMGLLKDSF